MKAFFLFFILLNLLNKNGFADHHDLSLPCLSNENFDEFSQIQKLSQHLSWFSAEDFQIENAPCKSKKIPTSEELNSFIQSKLTKKAVLQEKINGVEFRDESPELLRAFKHFTTSLDELGLRIFPEKQKNFQAEFSINPQCSKVHCALEKIWGKKTSEKMLYIYLKYNFNTSEYAFKDSDRFYDEELDDVLLALQDLPKQFLSLGAPNQRLTPTFVSNEKGKTIANAVIMLFDEWRKSFPIIRQYTLFHEFSHNIAYLFNRFDKSKEWLASSGWIKKGDEWTSAFDACFSSRYGASNPFEDFAESLSAYRYHGAQFKKDCPEKYELLKINIFKNSEYIDLSACPLFGM